MIEFRQITFSNWNECIKLKVTEEQENYVASNLYSLAEAYVAINSGDSPILYAIYADGVMVGFLMYVYINGEPEATDYQLNDHYFMLRLLIDKNHQGKGYGKQAVSKMVEEIKALPLRTTDRIYTSIEPTNIAAEKAYSSVGFMLTGEVVDNEAVMFLDISEG